MSQENLNQQIQNKEPELIVKFTLSQINIIISALEEIPHKYSRKIIDSIIEQSQEQLKQQENQ